MNRVRARETAPSRHWLPLSRPYRPGREITLGGVSMTDHACERLLRLPLWAGMTDADVERVVGTLSSALR